MLEDFGYISFARDGQPELQRQVEAILCSNGKDATYGHVCAVAEAACELASRFELDAKPCRMAALLHDISAVIRPADMLDWMEHKGAYIDEAERRHPFLLHQRMSRMVAAEDFGIVDPRVLSAVEVHTTLKAECSPYDLVVFLADKIAWDRAGEPPYREAVERGLERSLTAAALAYIDYVMDNGMILWPHQWLVQAREWLGRRK